MRIKTARVVNGRVDVDADALPDGRLVKVVLIEDEAIQLSEEERLWLTEALAAAKGDLSDAFAFLEELEGVR